MNNVVGVVTEGGIVDTSSTARRIYDRIRSDTKINLIDKVNRDTPPLKIMDNSPDGDIYMLEGEYLIRGERHVLAAWVRDRSDSKWSKDLTIIRAHLVDQIASRITDIVLNETAAVLTKTTRKEPNEKS